MPTLNLPELSRKVRLGLWISVIALTAIMVLFPLDLHYEYHALESIFAFGDRLPIFAIIFYIWIAALLLLLFARGETDEWQRMLLLSLFTLGIVGLWIVNTPYGGHPDELWQMGHVKYLLDTGKIEPAHPIFNYFVFPAFHILLASLSRVTGLGVFETRLFYMLISSVTFATLSYLLFVRLLKDARLASLGVLLLFLGCPMIYSAEKSFWPGNLAQLLFVALLLLLTWRQDKMPGVVFTLFMIILFTVFITSYLPTPTFFIFVLTGIYLLQMVNKKRVVSPREIILFLGMFITWEIFFLNLAFQSMLGGIISTFTAGFTEFGSRFSFVLGLGGTYAGDGAPIWAGLTKLFWMVSIFGILGILSIRNLVRVKRLDSMETIETGGIWGVVIFTLVVFLISPGVEQTGRFLLYAPFFAIPITLRFLANLTSDTGPDGGFMTLRGWLRKHIFHLLIILVFLLSLPSFLANNYRVLSHPIYPQENAAGQFLRAEYGDAELNLYSTPFTVTFYSYYVSEANFRVLWPTSDAAAGKEGLWLAMNQLLEHYEKSGYKNAIFVVSERLRYSYGPSIIIEPDDPRWVEYINRLEQNDKIYDNGFVQLYKRRAE